MVADGWWNTALLFFWAGKMPFLSWLHQFSGFFRYICYIIFIGFARVFSNLNHNQQVRVSPASTITGMH
jgi:hypothetical protein